MSSGLDTVDCGDVGLQGVDGAMGSGESTQISMGIKKIRKMNQRT